GGAARSTAARAGSVSSPPKGSKPVSTPSPAMAAEYARSRSPPGSAGQGGMPRDDAGQDALSGGHGAKRAVWPRGGCAAAGKARCAAVGGAGCSVPWHESADRSRAAEIFGHDEVRQII